MGALSGVSSQISTHVGVRDGDAAVGPVAALVIARRVLQLVRQAVDHDRAAGVPAVAAGVLDVVVVGVGDLDREEVVAAGIAAGQAIVAFGRAEIAFALLVADGIQPERDLVGAQYAFTAHEIQPPLAFADQDAVRRRHALQRVGRLPRSAAANRHARARPGSKSGRSKCAKNESLASASESRIIGNGGQPFAETSSTFGTTISTPGRISPISTSGLYCCSSHTGSCPERWVTVQSESPRRTV